MDCHLKVGTPTQVWTEVCRPTCLELDAQRCILCGWCAHHQLEVWVVVPQLGNTLAHEEPSPTSRPTCSKRDHMAQKIKSVVHSYVN